MSISQSTYFFCNVLVAFSQITHDDVVMYAQSITGTKVRAAGMRNTFGRRRWLVTPCSNIAEVCVVVVDVCRRTSSFLRWNA